MKGRDRADRYVAVVLGILTAIGSLEPIRNYDYFWHLASGRWILEHRALPASDPFTLASHNHAWINLEWLFQLLLYPLSIGIGHAGLTVALAVATGIGTSLLFLYIRQDAPLGGALFLSALAWMGAAHRIDLRPETGAIPILVVALALILRNPDRISVWGAPLLTIVWFAVHPSALLAPVMAGIVLVGRLGETRRIDSEIRRRVAQTLGCAFALVVNPWLLDGVLAPVRLASMLRREGLVNLEWLPSSPVVFPELYVVVAAGVVLLLWRPAERGRWARLLLFVFVALLAVRFVRNHAFFYPAIPLLLAPSLRGVPRSWDRLLLAGAGAALIAGLVQQVPGVGVDIDRFPVRTIERLERSGLSGNVYNPDQLGGYLVWSFYPERRALVDGRNELYLDFFRRFERARGDSREWQALFDDYDLSLAVEEYRDSDVEMIDAESGESKRVPPSTVYFPRSRWALIGFDEVSMLFAERASYPEEALRTAELISIIPDATRPSDAASAGIEEALSDLDRLERSVGSFRRLERLRGWLLEERDDSVDEVGAVE